MPKIDLAKAPKGQGTRYPAPFAAPCKGRKWLRLGDAGGLTQFGVNLLTLEPGVWSSQRQASFHSGFARTPAMTSVLPFSFGIRLGSFAPSPRHPDTRHFGVIVDLNTHRREPCSELSSCVFPTPAVPSPPPTPAAG